MSEVDLTLAADPDLAKGLGMNVFKGWGLEDAPGFVADYVKIRASIQKDGASATLKGVLARR